MTSLHPFEYAFEAGASFSPNERVQLSSSLPLLSAQTKRKELVLWGKIFGYKADYVIVEAFDDDAVVEPELYYTLDEGRSFNLLGTFSSVFAMCPGYDKCSGLQQAEWKQSMLLGMRGPFIGDPAYEYRVSNGAAARGTPELQSVKESVRLALFVEEFDHECRVVPRGAYVKAERQTSITVATTTGSGAGAGERADVRRNVAFCGLPRTAEGALSLRNYYHLRAVNPYRRLLARNQNSLFAKSALEQLNEHPLLDAAFEPLTEDVPDGTWQLRYDAFHNVVVGRNLRFAGSLIYHVPETPVYGTLYMGDGTVNINAAFEL
ncbi:Radial spokehead-like protein [Novymonas esmeraldas]|uniref:Radial spoke head protein 9 homolog n=1 Tax=Novymonas esmeraldas TaxID=1808958 RepID=A0AAW0F4Z5_9TRYP